MLQISKCRELRFFASFFPQKLWLRNFFDKYQVCIGVLLLLILLLKESRLAAGQNAKQHLAPIICNAFLAFCFNSVSASQNLRVEASKHRTKDEILFVNKIPLTLKSCWRVYPKSKGRLNCYTEPKMSSLPVQFSQEGSVITKIETVTKNRHDHNFRHIAFKLQRAFLETFENIDVKTRTRCVFFN